MTDGKFEKYIVYSGQTEPPIVHPRESTPGTEMFYIHDGVIKDAFTLCCTWMTGKPEMRSEFESAMTKQHYHDSAEYIGFIGCDYNNPHELGAKIEFWYEDEKYIIDKSCVLYIPKMLHHGPMVYLEVNAPFFIFSTLPDVNHEVHMVDNPNLTRP